MLAPPTPGGAPRIDVDVQEARLRMWAASDLEPSAAHGARIFEPQDPAQTDR